MGTEVKSKGMQRENNTSTVGGLYASLSSKRTSVLTRARKCAALTLPSLLPPEGHTESDSLTTPYQSLGARCVNNLAAKLLLTLLPPNSPFFRMAVSDAVINKMATDEEFKTKAESALAKLEHAVTGEIEMEALRVPAYGALKLLITTGNTLLYLPDSGGMKVYKIDQYVIRRNPMGKVLEMIVQERVDPSSLPDQLRDKVMKEGKGTEKIEVFTYIRRDNTMWKVRQEAFGETIPDTAGTYPIDECPWIPLRWTAVADEEYGRGMVEEYLGDFISLEGLNQAILEGAAAMAKILFLVNPNGTTKTKNLNKAKNGEFIHGAATDVTALQVEKYGDFRVALETAQAIEQRLNQAFLLMSSIQRQAERVTAEEIRAMASELEDGLGGTYSVLSQEMQLPLVRRMIARMRSTKKLPQFPKEMMQPVIVTGLEALGRGHDIDKLKTFVGLLVQLFPQEATTRLNFDNIAMRIATGLGIESEGMLKSPEQMQQDAMTAQAMQLVQGAGPGAIQEVMKGVMNGKAGQGQTPGAGQP